MALERLPWVLDDLDRRYDQVLAELHPELRVCVLELLDRMGGRVTPYCGFRDEQAQEAARRAGTSNASFGQSPHNYKPALACDLVLDPRAVQVRPHTKDPRYPDLWDPISDQAWTTWSDLHKQAQEVGLDRVWLRRRGGGRKLDKPHVQLRNWRDYGPRKNS